MQGQYDWFSIMFLVNHLRYDNKFEFVVSQVVYVARNPKDVIVSYFHHHKLLAVQDFTADIEKFADYFMKDELYYSPFFGHILEGWAKKNHPNLLFLFYEDMKRVNRFQLRNQFVCYYNDKSVRDCRMDFQWFHYHSWEYW